MPNTASEGPQNVAQPQPRTKIISNRDDALSTIVKWEPAFAELNEVIAQRVNGRAPKSKNFAHASLDELKAMSSEIKTRLGDAHAFIQHSERPTSAEGRPSGVGTAASQRPSVRPPAAGLAPALAQNPNPHMAHSTGRRRVPSQSNLEVTDSAEARQRFNKLEKEYGKLLNQIKNIDKLSGPQDDRLPLLNKMKGSMMRDLAYLAKVGSQPAGLGRPQAEAPVRKVNSEASGLDKLSQISSLEREMAAIKEGIGRLQNSDRNDDLKMVQVMHTEYGKLHDVHAKLTGGKTNKEMAEDMRRSQKPRPPSDEEMKKAAEEHYSSGSYRVF